MNKKSIRLVLVPLMAAAALAGCNDRVCVDKNGHEVDASHCEAEAAGLYASTFYYWYYGGSYHEPEEPPSPTPTSPTGWTWSANQERSESRSVSRGGFGGTAEGSGAGE
jgi:hypothetical protein